MQQSLRLLFALLLASTLFACRGGDKPGETTGGSGDTNVIRIGHLASMTGSEATFGMQTDQGVRLAMDEINAAGGINGKKIEIITEDNQSKTDATKTAIEKLLAKDKVNAVIGEVASGRTLAAAPSAMAAKVPLLSSASTNPDVTVDPRTGTVKDYIFRICFIDPFQGEVMAKFAVQKGWKKVAVLQGNAQAYSVGLAKNFKETFTKMGGQIVAEQGYEDGKTDFKGQLTSIKGNSPDAIFIPGYYNEVSLIAIQARELGINVPLFGGDGWDSPKLTEGAAGKALEGCFFSNHYSEQDTSAIVRDFIGRFQKKYSAAPGAMSALGYDAMMIIAKVIKEKGKADPESIRAGLAALQNYPGVTGTISIDAQHNARKPAVVLEIKGGKFTYSSTVAP